jgi:hypothetical protein
MMSIERPQFPSGTKLEEVARSCNEFKVLNEVEFNLVKGACVLAGQLSALLFSFQEEACSILDASALCRVMLPDLNIEEVTWYFDPQINSDTGPANEQKFNANCRDLGGRFEKLKYD